MSDGLSIRLGEVLDASGIAAREVDRLAGITLGHTLHIVSGRRINPETATIAAIAMTLGASLDWLVLSVGEKPSAREVQAAVERARVDPVAWRAELDRVLTRSLRSSAAKTARSKRLRGTPAKATPREGPHQQASERASSARPTSRQALLKRRAAKPPRAPSAPPPHPPLRRTSTPTPEAR